VIFIAARQTAEIRRISENVSTFTEIVGTIDHSDEQIVGLSSMLNSERSYMDPATSGKTLPAPTRKWEEFLGTIIALITLTLPVTAIALSSLAAPPPAAQVTSRTM
jgi:hypothetical protein